MSDAMTQATYVFGQYRLSPDKRLLQGADGRSIVLRGKAFDLLCYLLQHRGRLVSKTELLEALWAGTVVEENNLSQALSALRQALDDDAKAPRYIATVKGRGFQFIGDVRLEPESDDPPAAAAPRRRYGLALLVAAIVAAGVILWLVRETDETARPGSPVIDNFADATLTLVTDFAGSHSQPTLSPDGRMLAFVSDASGTPQIWVKNLPRGEPLQLTHGDSPASTPSWSPDTGQILYVAAGPDGSSITSIDVLGNAAPRTVVEYATAPNWSKRANAFVFARASQVWLARNDGRDIEKVIGIPLSQGFAAREPALSPDGTQIAFVHADEGPLGNLWLIPSAGGAAQQLTNLKSGGGIAGAPEWSSDGRYIVYNVEAVTSAAHLGVVNVETGQAAALAPGAAGTSDASLSGDGRRLAYTVTRTLWQLTRVNPQSGERSTIHSSRTPVLLPVASADGRRIVYFTRNATGMHLVMIGSDGSGPQQLTFDDAGANTLPTWAGDDESILYYRGRSLHRLNPADGSDEEVFADFHWSSHNWLVAKGDRVTYHIVDRPSGSRRTVVREIGESRETDLPVPVEGARWSADGRELVGWFRRTGELTICRSDGSSCETVEQNGEIVRGTNPAWSNDGQAIYYLRSSEDGGCCALFRVSRDGTSQRHIAELPDFDTSNSFYGVTANGDIFYNHVDRSTSEIWLAEFELR